MDAGDAILLLGGLGLIGWAIMSAGGEFAENAMETIEAATEGWANVNDGPTWVPVINQTESSLGIPTNLLARLAYEESRFRPDVISGETPSSAGALGLMQLMPQYFSTVQVPVPFSAADTTSQITQAGQQLVSLYQTFRDWGLALAGYNAGAGTVQAFMNGTQGLPSETQVYVAQILADVPQQSVLNA